MTQAGAEGCNNAAQTSLTCLLHRPNPPCSNEECQRRHWRKGHKRECRRVEAAAEQAAGEK